MLANVKYYVGLICPSGVVVSFFMLLLVAPGKPCWSPQAPSGTGLETMLDRMDRAATGFHGMSASFQRVQHLAVINEDNKDSGTILLKRVKPREMRMLVTLEQPDQKFVSVQGRKAEEYLPNMNTVQEIDLGKNRALLDQFFLIGFGTRRSELEAAYAIKLLGPENLNGQKVTRLELTPKSQDVLDHLKKLELWESDETGYPLRQKFFLPGGEFWTVTYSDIEINPNLPDSALKLQLPKGVKRENLQK
jgi:outer membrane lipoprotein-sorting protein